MTKSRVIGIRLTPAELEKLTKLSEATGQNPSEAVRTLIRSASAIEPERPAVAIFGNLTAPPAPMVEA